MLPFRLGPDDVIVQKWQKRTSEKGEKMPTGGLRCTSGALVALGFQIKKLGLQVICFRFFDTERNMNRT